jgi:tripartite ATP-independent transporter DctM subunit
MEWQYLMLLFFGVLGALFIIGIPIAFSFFLVNIIFMFVFWGGTAGLEQLVESLFVSVGSFTLLPMPLFVIMAEVLFRTDIAPKMIEALEKWLGRTPGRLGLLTVGSGTLFAALSGQSMSSVAVLGETLLPIMEKRGYKYPMSLGPILGSAGLAIMIPPSNLAVLLGAVGQVSVGKILIAIIVPGFLLAALYALYIIIRCYIQPDLAPAYDVERIPLYEKIRDTIKYVLPLGLIMFLVTGLIFVGIATPGEAAAVGALGTFVMAWVYGKLTWKLVKESFSHTLLVTSMIFMIYAGAVAFSQVVAFSGASKGFADFATHLPFSPLVLIMAMMIVSIILGMFINAAPIILLTCPLFIPVVIKLGFDPVWFAAMFLITLEMGSISPPFGMALFVMKGIAPRYSTENLYQSTIPFLMLDFIAIAIILVFPSIALWLPKLMF